MHAKEKKTWLAYAKKSADRQISFFFLRYKSYRNHSKIRGSKKVLFFYRFFSFIKNKAVVEVANPKGSGLVLKLAIYVYTFTHIVMLHSWAFRIWSSDLICLVIASINELLDINRERERGKQNLIRIMNKWINKCASAHCVCIHMHKHTHIAINQSLNSVVCWMKYLHAWYFFGCPYNTDPECGTIAEWLWNKKQRNKYNAVLVKLEEVFPSKSFLTNFEARCIQCKDLFWKSTHRALFQINSASSKRVMLNWLTILWREKCN